MIYDVRGRVVRSLAVGPSTRAVEWDGRGRAGTPVPAGVYFARFRTQEGISTQKLVKIR